MSTRSLPAQSSDFPAWYGEVVRRAGLADRLFFANASYVKGRVHEAIRAAPSEASWLVLDAEAVTHVDSSGIEMLSGLQRELEGEQITLVVARLRERMLPDLEAADLVEQIGRERFYPSVNRALAAFKVEQS